MISPKKQNPFSFPPAWLWAVDELIPQRVKSHYSPYDNWKNKPFSSEDVQFFSKGVLELSELFTLERSKKLNQYFSHPKFRSSYLLYFLPLQAAKFLTLFQMHPHAISACMSHGRKQGRLTVADFGAGPATASLSFLLHLLNVEKKEIPPIDFYWFDMDEEILKEGRFLVETLGNQFPKLRGKIKIHSWTLPWWKAAQHLPQELSLSFFGNVLNESALPHVEKDKVWDQFLNDRMQGGGILFVEPASRHSAQQLSQLRDGFFETQLLKDTPQSIWGPCLHSGRCPLATGKDWCHLSVPVDIPGKWFKAFSKVLSSERLWAKFSYLWIASPKWPSALPAPDIRRVISDPIPTTQGKILLLCEPERAFKWKTTTTFWRGETAKLPPQFTS